MNMRTTIKDLISRMDTCVLATVSSGTPHCSLMAYAANEDCTELYMATLRNTKKFQNLTREPLVSLLIDTRGDSRDMGLSNTVALTVAGRFMPFEDPDSISAVKSNLERRHPGLASLVRDPKAEIIRIKVQSFLLLDGPRDATFVEI